ncbi:MAG: hypothetical protein IJW31_01320 [Lentisphaeria bacterium]|nr:hypothetical protein [Lentisphaeria bacterium]
MPTKMRFKKIASARQLIVDKATDLRKIELLDSAHWAVNGMGIDHVVFNKDFLNYIDSDKNQRVRVSEVKSAVAWLLAVLKNYHAIDERSTSVTIEDLNYENNSDAQDIKNTVELIAGNLHKEGVATLTFEELSYENLYMNSSLNGDGVIVIDKINNAELQKYLRAVEAIEGNVPDKSTLPGIGKKEVDSFHNSMLSYLDWYKGGKVDYRDGEVLEFIQLHKLLRDKLIEFFDLCEAANFKIFKSIGFAEASVNGNNAADIKKFFEDGLLGEVNPEGQINFRTSWLNPCFKSSLLKYGALGNKFNLFSNSDTLSAEEFKNKLADIDAAVSYYDNRPNDKFKSLAISELESWVELKAYEEVCKLIELDLSVKSAIDGYEKLRKLMVYQANILEFVNNYVNLSGLFDPNRFAIMQTGVLVLDGKHFSLITKVKNLPEHKKIISRSNICVAYIEVTGIGGIFDKSIMAVAITAGTMRNIYIGKMGIFCGCDGKEYDAKLIDLIQQPVSVKEALLAPFVKFGEFSTKQADRFFSSKNQELDKAVTNDIKSGKLLDSAKAPANGGKTSLPMLLMGGGFGLAAVGSAFAFMINSLKSVSVWQIFAVLFGIILVISAPMLLVSLSKLYNRCISDFLAASEWAINPRMRLSNRMSLIFSIRPKYPKCSVTVRGADMVNEFFKNKHVKDAE